MHSTDVNWRSRLRSWQRVREYAVPQPMIKASTARRLVGDWAGACTAARIDVELDLRALRRGFGVELATTVRDDLRHLAPDLLRWHMPRVMPDGLLRPGLTVSLARYRTHDVVAHLVVRTPPAWASGPQRMILSWWDGSAGRHPHPRPDRRFRLDLHRHLWDARRAGELADRASALGEVLDGGASQRWAAEAEILRTADGVPGGDVVVRLGSRRLVLGPDGSVTEPQSGARPSGPRMRPLMLPDAATWVPPDLLLLDAGMAQPAQLHPLVAEALGFDGIERDPQPAPPGSRLVDCRGAVHRLRVVDGVLTAPDHDPVEIRREQLLAMLTGTPLPCLQVIDRLHRAPVELDDVRARLDHGDPASAVAVVEDLLGVDAVLRVGDLQAELAAAASARTAYGVYRAGLSPVLLDPDAQRSSARVQLSGGVHRGARHRTPRRRLRQQWLA